MRNTDDNNLYMYPITSESGLKHYYDHLKFRGHIIDDTQTVLRKIPTIEEFKDYTSLRKMVSKCDYPSDTKVTCMKEKNSSL